MSALQNAIECIKRYCHTTGMVYVFENENFSFFKNDGEMEMNESNNTFSQIIKSIQTELNFDEIIQESGGYIEGFQTWLQYNYEYGLSCKPRSNEQLIYEMVEYILHKRYIESDK